jgi:hypothetical protein
MFQKYYLYAASLLIIAPGLIAMEKSSDTQEKKESTFSDQVISKLKAIRPFQTHAFDHIPQYLYENCNQVMRYTWSPESFAKLKKAVGKCSRDGLHKQLQKEFSSLAAKNQPLFNVAEEYTKRAESYDWIHALNLIETEYLMKTIRTFTIGDLQKINAAITRNTTEHPGSFRTTAKAWCKRDLTTAETILSSWVMQNRKNIRQGKDPFLKADETLTYLEVSGINKLLLFFKENPTLLQEADADGALFEEPVNIDELQQWLDQQQLEPEWKGYLNYDHWFENLYIPFPAPSGVKELITEALSRGFSMPHPIVLAGFLWFSIIRIHPWDEAHKRTGKALAIKILLEYGFLPPLIEGEDGERFIKLVSENIRNPSGHLPLIELLMELIEKTQKQFEGQVL